MSGKNVKDIRSQVRNVTKECLPAILTEELAKTLYAGLQRHIDERLDVIARNIRDSLDAIDTRSKETQSYLVRQATAQAPAPKE